MAGTGWDLTSTKALQAAAAWLLKKAGPDALFIVIVRVEDVAVSADLKLMPRDVVDLIELRAPEFAGILQAERTERLRIIDNRNAKVAKKQGVTA